MFIKVAAVFGSREQQENPIHWLPGYPLRNLGRPWESTEEGKSTWQARKGPLIPKRCPMSYTIPFPLYLLLKPPCSPVLRALPCGPSGLVLAFLRHRAALRGVWDAAITGQYCHAHKTRSPQKEAGSEVHVNTALVSFHSFHQPWAFSRKALSPEISWSFFFFCYRNFLFHWLWLSVCIMVEPPSSSEKITRGSVSSSCSSLASTMIWYDWLGPFLSFLMFLFSSAVTGSHTHTPGRRKSS